MIQRLYYILLSCLPLCSAYAQKYAEPDKLRTFNIVVNYDSYTVKTQMLKDCKKIRVQDDRSYLWCSANRILETQAGYDGKLLHGYYKSFYFDNNQLRESGTVRYGLRHREWRYWYADGQLREVIHYKNGKKNGSYKLYNDYGHLMAKGRFKNDRLQGKFYTYNNQGAIEATKKYRRGAEIIKTPKPARIKKQQPDTTARKKSKDKPAKPKKPGNNTQLSKKKKPATQDAPVADKPKKAKKPGRWKEWFKKKESKKQATENNPEA